MSKSKAARSSDSEVLSVDDLFVVDTDAHVTDHVDDFLPYANDRYKGVKKMIERASSPLRDIYSVTHCTPVFQHSEGYGDELFGEKAETRHQNAKLKEMEEFDIDYSIVNPTLNLAVSTVQNTRAAVTLMDGYNRWLVSEFIDEHESLKGTILVAPQKPDLAADEIDEWANEDDMVGVIIPGTGTVPPLGHQMYDPIYEAAERHGLPIVVHGVSGAGGKSFPIQREWNETYAEDHVTVHPFSLMWNLTSMMFQGVPERFPDLKFNFQEAGVGWIPYTIWRLNDHYMSLSDEVPYLTKLPSAYIKDQFYFSTQPVGHIDGNPEHLAWAMEMADPELIMYSSDLPHPDFDTPEFMLNRIRSYFDEETVRGIMGETGRELYDL